MIIMQPRKKNGLVRGDKASKKKPRAKAGLKGRTQETITARRPAQ